MSDLISSLLIFTIIKTILNTFFFTVSNFYKNLVKWALTEIVSSVAGTTTLIREWASRYHYLVMSKYHHAPKQAWQTGVLIQCRYGLSGIILFIFLIILNIWIYYTITFYRFTFCFYILMAKQTNRRKQSVFNETHLQKIFFRKLKNYEIMWKKKNGHRNNAMNSQKN